jgi:hypothetical protein
MSERLGMILIDVVDESTIDARSTGHAVKVCHGPDETHVCPMLTGDPCPLAEEAHGVVFALDLDRPAHRAILNAYKQNLREDVPIGVSVRPGQMAQYADLLKGVRVWDHAPAAGDLDALAAEVEAADDLA